MKRSATHNQHHLQSPSANISRKRIWRPSANSPQDVSHSHSDPAKTHHYSVSIDQHLLKEKYAAAKELFETGKYDRLVPVVRHIIRHFEYSNAQKNLYYWLGVSLMHQRKYEEAVEEMSECLSVYSNFQEGFLCLACSYLRLKRYRLATDNYLHAIRLNPKAPAPYLQLAHCYHAMKDYAKAL